MRCNELAGNALGTGDRVALGVAGVRGVPHGVDDRDGEAAGSGGDDVKGMLSRLVIETLAGRDVEGRDGVVC
jgi:hypothetical protein